jgi:hypothetical protein
MHHVSSFHGETCHGGVAGSACFQILVLHFSCTSFLIRLNKKIEWPGVFKIILEEPIIGISDYIWPQFICHTENGSWEFIFLRILPRIAYL